MSFLEHEPKREMGIGPRILLAPVGLLLLLLFLVFGLPVMDVIAAKDALSFRAFRRREAGNVYFICTSRRGWHDLLKNNVIPVLPDRFRVIWTRRAGGTHPPDLYNYFLRSGVVGEPKPMMVAVTRRALVHQSLNAALQEFKADGKISEDTQRKCAQLISQVESELIGSANARAAS